MSEPVHSTTASLIAELPADRTGAWPIWISFGTPCTGIFLPIYLDGVIPATLARGDATPSAGSAWWTFRRLQEAAEADPVRHTRLLREGWADFEEKIEAERPEIEGTARRAVIAGEPDRGSRIVSDFMARMVEEALKRAETLRARIS